MSVGGNAPHTPLNGNGTLIKQGLCPCTLQGAKPLDP